MPVLSGKELRIVGFLCNWCSYGGADTAGVARLSQPTDLRIIRVPCSGRVDPLFVAKALLSGADGVLVSGCHPRDCHYSQGNLYARRRLEVLKTFLPALGIDPARFEYVWVSASEGQRWKNVVTSFTERIHALGPAPRLEKAEPFLPGPASPEGPLRRELRYAPAETQAANLNELRRRIKAALPGLDCVIGWERGFDTLHATPLFMRAPEDVDRLIWGPLSVHNLSVFLPGLKGRKVGVVAKGCDSRSVVQLLQEKLVNPDEITVFGLSCEGVIDPARLLAALDREGLDTDAVDEVRAESANLRVQAGEQTVKLPLADIVADKCRACATPLPLLGEVVQSGEHSAPAPERSAQPAPGLALLESMNTEERLGFWRGQMERCLRCHACRNACPLCVCRDHCLGESRDPHWCSEENSVREKFQFQVIHALHLAGRCTECGECQRACPVDIPVLALKQWLGRSMRELFDHEAGLDPQAAPPLLTFAAEEKNIKEHEL
ncbi:MAG: hydrogenase iron-sulfur subunit [Desulfovibrionaceae bacterium]